MKVTAMNFPGTFVISIDFELHWGCFEYMRLDDIAKRYFLNTRQVIPKKLDLFASNDIHATWAIVGMLYNQNVSGWNENLPKEIPTYDNSKVSSYEWINKNKFISEEDLFHFAPALIDQIKKTPNQEIGTHTYSHYFCLEPGQNQNQFREDLLMATILAKAKGITFSSLVFPRNQFNPEYLSICREMGITSVRSNPAVWYWKPSPGSSLLKKVFRSGDAYLKIQPSKKVFLSEIKRDYFPLLLPATRLYRSWKPQYRFQNRFKLQRILDEMTTAAKDRAYYHLWWHPHNFGNHPEECLLELEQIIEHYKKLHYQYGFQSMNMRDVTELLT